MEKNVLFCATRRAYQDCIVAMKSLLHHTDVDRVFMFAEDDQIPGLPDFVSVINVSNQHFFKGAVMEYRLTYMALMRIAAGSYLDVDTVLSLDNDIIVRKDISPLFDIDMSKYVFAGVKEAGVVFEICHDSYTNFGIALLNLRELRKIDDGLISILNIVNFVNGEQDILTLMCRKRILNIPSIYNCSKVTVPCEENEAIIRHYAGVEDKQNYYSSSDYKKYYEMPWSEVLKRHCSGDLDKRDYYVHNGRAVLLER